MTKQEFAAQGLGFSREAGVEAGLHRYFVQHCTRLYETFRRFRLFDGELGDVLEIGPFYGYTPFFLQACASSQVILEGDDPAVYLLKPLYEKRKIRTHFVDLFEIFGPTHTARHTLPLANEAFNTILCWETMEHLNFNPVKFVRELHRVLKPGGRVYVTVPNKASFQSLFALISGLSDHSAIDTYFEFENYVSNGKNAFYGFHWREYSPGELRHLFSKVGFLVPHCSTLVAFQTHARTSIARQIVRGVNRLVAGAIPRHGTNVCLVAERPVP